MRGFVYKLLKQNELKKELNYYFGIIDNLKNCNHTYQHCINKNLIGISYTNEPKTESSYHYPYYFAYSGQLTTSFEKIKNDLINYNPDKMKNYIKDMSGAFALSTVYLPNRTVRVFTHFARINPVYYYEDNSQIIIGTDPLIVRAMADESQSVIISVEQSLSFLMNGFYGDDETLFKDVRAAPANTEILIKNNKIYFNEIDNTINNMFTKTVTEEDYDELTDIYLKSYDVVPKSNQPHRIGLTGGKDSRLIALGLLEKNIPFTASTKGFSDHPDVVIAKELARKLNINHTINKPAINKANEIEMDLVDKILKPMIGTSGNVFGYENINYNPVYNGRIGLTGVGAECIKGGYDNHRNKKSDNVTTELLRAFFAHEKFILDSKGDTYKTFLSNFGQHANNFQEAQYRQYIFYRIGRWVGGTRNSILYSTDMYSPFFDNQFLKKAMQLDLGSLINEKIHYNIMKRLNPEIADINFYATRWGFEQKGPVNPHDYKRWLKRNPVYATTQIGAFNWRMLRNEDPTLRNAMKEIILSNPNDELFNIVNYSMIEQVLKKPVPATLNKFIWSLASVKLYKDYLLNKNEVKLKPLKLKTPAGKVRKIKNPPQIKDLTDIFYPINTALEYTKKNDGFIFSNNKEGKGNPYIQTGDEKLPFPPKKYKNTLNVTNYKRVFVRLSLESESEVDFDFYIMQYNQDKRIKSELFEVKHQSDLTYIDKNIVLKEQTQFIKFAIHFKSKEDSWKVHLKYSYISLR